MPEHFLKEVKLPANAGSLQSLKLNNNFRNFCSHFGLWMQRHSTNTKKYFLKIFLETLSLFSQPEFLEKGRVVPKLDRSCGVTGRVNII